MYPSTVTIDTSLEAHRHPLGGRYSPQNVYDGDLTLLIDDKTIMSGVDRSCPVVIDVEDKITALSEDVVPENVLKLIKRTLHSMIGETSNCATAYHNKIAGTEAQKKKYQDYVNLLSIINGKSIN